MPLFLSSTRIEMMVEAMVEVTVLAIAGVKLTLAVMMEQILHQYCSKLAYFIYQ